MEIEIKKSWNSVRFHGTVKELNAFIKVKDKLDPPPAKRSKKSGVNRNNSQ